MGGVKIVVVVVYKVLKWKSIWTITNVNFCYTIWLLDKRACFVLSRLNLKKKQQQQLTKTNMAPPQYADLGKAAKDLFNKGYSTFIITHI